jgi:hypothetical protein
MPLNAIASMNNKSGEGKISGRNFLLPLSACSLLMESERLDTAAATTMSQKGKIFALFYCAHNYRHK